MGDKQWGELQAAFESPDLACMIVASEIPFVTSSPADAKVSSLPRGWSDIVLTRTFAH